MSHESRKIYILHGWAYETSKWGPFLEKLKEQGFEAVLLKIPGLTAPLNKAWTLDDYVEWLKSRVASRESQITILGHSNGGRIALAFALKYPRNVKELILIDSAGIKHNDFSSKTKRAVFKSVAKIGKKVLPKSSRKVLYKIARVKDYKEANPIMQKTMENLIDTNLAPELNKLKTPTIIIWGKEDKTTPYRDGQVLAREIKNSQLYTIDSARHSPMFTNVDEVARIVVSSLRLPASGGRPKKGSPASPAGRNP